MGNSRRRSYIAIKRVLIACAAISAAGAASPSFAQAGNSYPIADARSYRQNLADQIDLSGLVHPKNVLEGLDQSGNPRPAYVDANGLLHVSVDQGGGGGGGGGSVPTGSAGSPNPSVLTVQGIAGGTGIPTTPSNAAQNHTDITAPQSAAGTSAATAVTVQGSASGVALKTSEANSAAIAASEASTATNTGTVAANQLGTANFAPAQVSVTSSATPLVSLRAARRSVTLYNTGSSTVFLGGSGVSAATGFPLPGGATLTLTYAGALYGITASGSDAVSEYEVF